MALIGFTQDDHPDAPPGAGYFHADSGESAYAYDPNLAAQFSGQAPPQQAPQDNPFDLTSAAGPDQRFALGGTRAGLDLNSQNMAVDQGPQQAQPTASDAAPDYSPPAGPSTSAAPQAAPNASVAGPQSSAAGAPPPPQALPPEVDPDEQLRAQLQAGINAPVRVGATPGGLRPKSAEVTTEGAEAPMSQADWRELQDANEAIAQTQVAKAGVLRAQAETQMAQAGAQLPGLQAKYDADQAKYDQARAAAKQDLAKVNGLLQDVNNKKVDHNRLFGKPGSVGSILAGVAQAAGTWSAIMSRSGHNMVADQINGLIDHDVAEQRDEIENGKASANNALQMLRDRYNFDIPQAESALKISQLGVVNAQLKQFEGMKMSQDAQQGLESWMAENQKAQFLEARKLYTQSMGKQTRKESMVYQQGSAGGTRAPTTKEQLERIAVAKGGQEIGAIGKPGQGNDIPPALVVYDTNGKAVAARTEPEAVKVREKYAMYKKIMPSLAAMDASAGHFNTLSPDEQATFKINFETAVSTLNNSLGQGQMKTDDFQRWNDYMSQGNFGVKKAISEVRAITKNAYQAEVDSQTGGAVNEDFGKGKPKAKYNNKRATTPTVGRSQAGTSATPDELKAALAGFAQ